MRKQTLSPIHPDPTVLIDLQLATRSTTTVPNVDDFFQWVQQTLRLDSRLHGNDSRNIELTIRIVDEQESAALNSQFRHKTGATNILSFPTDLSEIPEITTKVAPLGDLVICNPLVLEQAVAQHKAPLAHWAHLTVHGVLHLLGYDHQTELEASQMETLEIQVLQQLGYPNPYVIKNTL